MAPSTRYIVWMDFDSICYHYNYLVANLHNECSFRVLPLFKDIPDDIIKCVRIAYPYDTTEYTPTLTGVPPHVLLMSEMEILRRKIDDHQKGINSDTDKIIDERGVGGNEFHTNSILSAIEE